MPRTPHDDRFIALRASGDFPEPMVARFRGWLDTAPELDVFRTNPMRYAAAQGEDARIVQELFLHAVRVGILDFAWGVLCPRCGMFLGTRAALQDLGTHRNCGLCRVQIVPCPDDNVEVSFTVNPGVRTLRFHRPFEELAPMDAMAVSFSTNLILAPGFMDAIERELAAHCVIAPGEVCEMAIDFEAEMFYAMGAPLHHASTEITLVPGAAHEASIDLLEGGAVPAHVELGTGPGVIRVRNRSQRPAQPAIRRIPQALAAAIKRGEVGWPVPALPIFKAQQLLASQAFRDLFRAESLPTDAGLEVRSLAVLFTDLKGSTALYDRVGDLRAFALVRDHFTLLRAAVRANGGAVVKTMGDAIMATFADSLSAMRASLAMQDAIGGLGSDLLLKVGVHTGGCVAVENDERLDYFGQTVNIAARVQALAAAREIVVTDVVYGASGVAALAERAALVPTREDSALRGVEGTTRVVRLRPISGGTAAPA
jgi:class 3 adenylate cyclase